MPMAAMARTAPLEDASALLAEPARLRERAAADGYLYLPGLLTASTLAPTRRGVVAVLGHPRTVSVQTRERKRVRIVLSRREVLSVALW